MRIPVSHSVHVARPMVAAVLVAILARAHAQEPTPAPEQPPAPARNEAPANRDGEGRRPRRQPIVIEAGTVHPVAGPAIENGVVVVRGERIVAVGKKGEVEVPANAVVHAFPTGHVYPGLVDAATDAFTDNTLRGDGGNDGGSTFVDDLRLQRTRADELARAGITTAYVTVRSPALVRGQGAIVRPRQDGFDVWQGKEHAALQLRLTDGAVPSHALQRQQQQQAVDAMFEGLEDFRKQRTDHDEALKKYDKEFADYLAWYQKKKDGDKKPEGGAEAPRTGEQPAPGPAGDRPRRPGGGPGGGNRGGGNGGNGGGGGNEPPKEKGASEPSPASAAELERAIVELLEPPQDPVKQDPPKQDPPKTEGNAPPPGAPAEKKDEAPKRPTYPKAPARDPQREALLKVLDGELPLRVEAHRADELRAALRLQRDRQVPVLVLEQAYGAASLVDEIANAGASVVLTECLPVPFDPPYDAFETVKLPAKLAAAGVPFAIASGRAQLASMLPLLAAAAVGGGLPRDQALRAITLTPAEILGVSKDTGSLQAGKYADVVVTDRPLFQTDSHILLVLAKGRTEYEVK